MTSSVRKWWGSK